jgi:hypothetical protein
MKGFEFLKKVSLASVEATKAAAARTSTAKARNPETADIRIFKDGSVYPSAALVQEFDLTYRAKDAAQRGQAFDVFKTTDCPHMANWAADEKAIFIAAVDRTEPKTDLFSSSKYDENGEPTADVLTQGANTFGKQLLADLKEVYGIEPGESGFIDLSIMREAPLTTDNGIYFIPKTVSRGENKGKSDLVRRENLTLYPLVPADAATEAEETSAPATSKKKVAEAEPAEA